MASQNSSSDRWEKDIAAAEELKVATELAEEMRRNNVNTYAELVIARAKGIEEKPSIPTGPIAISQCDHHAYGCPYCGYRSGSCSISGGGVGAWSCGECQKTSFILAAGLTVSPMGIGGKDQETIYPKLQKHPRKGIPKHGKPDKRPENGGEFFYSRGVGVDSFPGCFVCGEETFGSNIAAFVQCKAAGERVVEMFDGHCRLDYREYSPDRVQVKLGCCKKHLCALEYLAQLVRDHILTVEKIEEAKKYNSRAHRIYGILYQAVSKIIRPDKEEDDGVEREEYFPEEEVFRLIDAGEITIDRISKDFAEILGRKYNDWLRHEHWKKERDEKRKT